ncbi:hypothetical protein MIND_01099900 [Mycena indigotica]|uniref:Uncharacterized protein n=1 Tax=Mycena indigotica TaxID=2126181 RepID=A0A8H6SAZ4_9AGAR|nr:uncharacterized protein MIND_01099900 [Mycena indigotica]KAF7295598.1 hypothetical protein MIND_01099900 [Mycena indigotica]
MSQTEGPSPRRSPARHAKSPTDHAAAADAARQKQLADHLEMYPPNTVVPGSEGWTAPAFRIFLESSIMGSREEVQPGHRYYPIHAYILTAFNHLLASDRALKEIITPILSSIVRLGRAPILRPTEQRGRISISDVEEALKTGMPNVFIRTLAKPTQSGPPAEFPWGTVGTNSENDAIELSICKELCDVLCPLTPIPNAALQESFKLILLVTIEHELMHVLTKLFFGYTFITPQLPNLQKDRDASGNRIGESGRTFEMSYIGFQIQAEWALPLVEPTSDGFPNLEKMVALVAQMLQGCQVFRLEPQDVHNMVASFSSKDIWIPMLKESYLPLPPINTNCTLRYSVSLQGLEDDEEEEPESNNQNSYRLDTGCGTHSLQWDSSRGLGISFHPQP